MSLHAEHFKRLSKRVSFISYDIQSNFDSANRFPDGSEYLDMSDHFNESKRFDQNTVVQTVASAEPLAKA